MESRLKKVSTLLLYRANFARNERYPPEATETNVSKEKQKVTEAIIIGVLGVVGITVVTGEIKEDVDKIVEENKRMIR